MSVEVWTYLLVGLTFALYIYIGYASRVRETAGFYVAGRGVPAIANGAATAADWMSAASFISMAGLISFMGYDGAVYLMGWTGGYVLLALLLAPYLRKYGKYTVPDFIGDRYYSHTARAVAAIATIFISLTYVAGQMRGVGIVFSRFLQVDIATGVIIGVAVVAFFAVLGGMKGITWTQVAQYTVLIIAYLIPAIAIANVLTGNPIPQLAFTFSDLVSRLNQIQVDLGFTEYTKPFQGKPMIDILAITLALMVGTAGLPHVIIRFYTVPDVRSARYSAGWALLFIALLYTTAPALAAFARYNLISTLHGKTLEEVRQIDWVAKWEKTKLLAFVDKDGDGKITVAPGRAFALKGGKPDFNTPDEKSKNEVHIDNDIIVLSTPEVAKLAPWVIALVAAGGLAAALSTAAGLLLAMSSAISHDIYYRIFRPNATEAQRLLAGRIVILLAVILAGYFGVNPPGFVAQVVAFAFGLAAASLFPAILLGIFDKRMNREGAIAGILVGLIFTAVMIGMMRAPQIFGAPAPVIPNLFGISAEGVGVIGMILNFVVAYVVSRATPPPPDHIQHLVEDIRIPKGAGQAAEH
ncbi:MULTISPECIES: sodium:solute symporter family protein [Thermus]|uniref:SSS sodium solute transporter superfamily n=1 Tax=Thermus scotoductus (strain ATCC 700910 / SA-01) TaxID=743525 RepID=E8PN17_THESS|nr:MULTISPECIES: sodium:solute symporter family protein [Thermus]ADW21368.1 SSS sodium solute transporter superfamily [Thermus scotoductus SA-01]